MTPPFPDEIQKLEFFDNTNLRYRSALLEYKAVLFRARLEEMRAANQMREIQGHSQAYCDDHFQSLAVEMEEEIERIVNPKAVEVGPIEPHTPPQPDIGMVASFAGKEIPMDKDLTEFEMGISHFVLMLVRRFDKMNYWMPTQTGLSNKQRFIVMRSTIWPEMSKFLGVEFGDKDYQWTPQAAFDLADEWNEER